MYVIGKVKECLSRKDKTEENENTLTASTEPSPVLDASQEPETPTETFEIVEKAAPENTVLKENLEKFESFVDKNSSIAELDLKDPLELKFFKMRKELMVSLHEHLQQLKASTEKLNNLTGISSDSQLEKISCLTYNSEQALQTMSQVEAEHTSKLAAENEIGDDWELV
uniref:Biogenesis of lysosome-related organelles complex 1 subunit 3 n=1 Tax=Panagrellus redivivus TaxID=6233 RepID=A0A7E4ZXH2_PANRE